MAETKPVPLRLRATCTASKTAPEIMTRRTPNLAMSEPVMNDGRNIPGTCNCMTTVVAESP